MNGILALIFGTGCTAVTFGFAFHYWQAKRYRTALCWAIGFALSLGVAGFFTARSFSSEQIVQQIAPAEKNVPYIKEARLEAPLTAGKPISVLLLVQNGATESTVMFRDLSYALTGELPTKYLPYSKGKHSPGTLKLAPRQAVVAKWSSDEIIVNQQEIDALNAKPPLLEYYAYARGEYVNETGKHSLDVCFKYASDFPTGIVICSDDIKIE